MKLTQSQLRRIIKEELEAVVNEATESADLFKLVRDEDLVMGNVDRDAFFKWLRAGDLTTADAVKANRGMIAGWLKKNR